MDEFVPLGGSVYCLLLSVLLVARAMDFLSTWIATPNLLLEANPVARKLGWRWGVIVNLVICGAFAVWPLPAIVISTTSILVAARNLQAAWLMRSLGEHEYRSWMAARLGETPWGLYLFCLVVQAVLIASVGACLMYFSDLRLVPFAVGGGIVTYAVAVAFYSMLSVWRLRRQNREGN